VLDAAYSYTLQRGTQKRLKQLMCPVGR